jgi:hypothetical protein
LWIQGASPVTRWATQPVLVSSYIYSASNSLSRKFCRKSHTCKGRPDDKFSPILCLWNKI